MARQTRTRTTSKGRGSSRPHPPARRAVRRPMSAHVKLMEPAEQESLENVRLAASVRSLPDERFARGEIDEEEYRRRRGTLEGSRG